MSNLRSAFRSGRLLVDGFRHTVRWHQSTERIGKDAQAYWADTNSRSHAANSHWRDAFGSEDDWRQIGRPHLQLFEQFARMTETTQRPSTILEWGCGGGANAVHFAPLADRFIGVEVSQPTLDECAKRLQDISFNHFDPVLIDVNDPEAALATVGEQTVDLFLSTYVFELVPTPEYAQRLLVIAQRLLRAGGMALIQIKYDTGSWKTRPRRWGYKLGVANMTTFRIEAFWQHAIDAGLTPHGVVVVPKQEMLGDERYAYFCLTR